MCPVCLGSAVWLITGGVSGLGATAGGLGLARDKNVVAKISKLWKPATPRQPHSSAAEFPQLPMARVQEQLEIGETDGHE